MFSQALQVIPLHTKAGETRGLDQGFRTNPSLATKSKEREVTSISSLPESPLPKRAAWLFSPGNLSLKLFVFYMFGEWREDSVGIWKGNYS